MGRRGARREISRCRDSGRHGRSGSGIPRETDRGGGRTRRRRHSGLSRRQGTGRSDAQAAHPQGRDHRCVLSGARRLGIQEQGLQPLLDAVIDYLPSPLDVPPIKGIDDKGNEVVRRPDDKEPMSLLAFKIMDDPYVGTITFCRIYSGTLTSGSGVFNSTRERRERIGRMLLMHANNREDIKEAYAGDIVALAGLKEARTGDTLCDPHKPVILEMMEFPAPVIEIAIEPKSKADQEKLGVALAKLAAEDPSFH